MNLITTLAILTLTAATLLITVTLTALAIPLLAVAVFFKNHWVTQWICYQLGRGVRWYCCDYLNISRKKKI